MAHFFCRLLPPRPTFAGDMTDEERAVMKAHVDYWRPFVDGGIVSVMGPVADPKGAWGLLVIEAPSQGFLDRLLADDPAILSGRGFHFETLPMLNALRPAIERLAPVDSVTP